MFSRLDALEFFSKIFCNRHCLLLLSLFFLSAAKVIAQDGQNALTLELGKPIERALASGESHSYNIKLTKGQFLYIVVEQRDIDIVVAITDPMGAKLLEIDSPNGRRGVEPLALKADVAGTYSFKVRPLDEEKTDGRYQVKIEELRAATEPDSKRLEAQKAFMEGNELRKKTTKESLNEARVKYSEALSLYKSLKDQEREALLLELLAAVYTSLGYNARDYYNQLIPVYRSRGDLSALAATRYAVGNLNRKDRPWRALESYQQALSLFQKVNDQPAAARTLFNIGTLYTQLHDDSKALDAYVQSLDISRAAGNQEWVAEILERIGKVYFCCDLYDAQKALDHYKQALAVYERMDSRQKVADLLYAIGTVYDFSFDHETENALSYYNRALEAYRLINQAKPVEANLKTYSKLESIIAADNALKEGQELFAQGRAVSDVMTRKSLFSRALEKMKPSVSLFQSADREDGAEGNTREAHALYSLGLIYEALGEIRQALDYYNQALSIYRPVYSDKQDLPKEREAALQRGARTTLEHIRALTRNMPEMVVQTGHVDRIESIAFSPDGTLLASGAGTWGVEIKLWEVATGKELRTLPGKSAFVHAMAWSPDGRMLATVSSRSIKIWDVTTGAELRSLNGHEEVKSIAFNVNGKLLASGGDDGRVRLWEVATGKQLHILKGHAKQIELPEEEEDDEDDLERPGHVFSLTFSPDGLLLASTGSDAKSNSNSVKLWEVSSGKEVRTLTVSTDQNTALSFSADGKALIISSTASVRILDVATGVELRKLEGRQDWHGVTFSPDGTMLATLGAEKTIELWNIKSGTQFRSLKENHDYLFVRMAFSADGAMFASSGGDGSIQLVDVATGTEIRTLKGHKGTISSNVYSNMSVEELTFSADGTLLASGSDNGIINLWDMTGGKEPRALAGHKFGITEMCFSTDGKLLASLGEESVLKLWDVATGRQLYSFKQPDADDRDTQFIRMALSPDGKLVAAGDYNGNIKLWDVATGTERRTIKPVSVRSMISALVFSPDGKLLASTALDAKITLWDVATGAKLRTFATLSLDPDALAFSPDGKLLAANAGYSGRVRRELIKLWDVSTGAEVRTLQDHVSEMHSNVSRSSNPIEAVAFSSDGKTIIRAAADNTVRLWDVSSGAELVPPAPLPAWPSFHGRKALSHINGKPVLAIRDKVHIHLVDPNSGQRTATITALSESDWLVSTPQGLFDGSSSAWSQIIWRFNNDTFNYAPVEAFFKEYWQPGLLQDIMAWRNPKPPDKDLSEIDIRRPNIKIAHVDGQQAASQSLTLAHTLTERNVEIILEVEENAKTRSRAAHPQAGGAQDLRLFRNGSLVKFWQGDIFGNQTTCRNLLPGESNEGRRVACKVTVPIIAGDNHFTAYAFNHDNIKSSDASLTVTGADSLKRPGTAYILAVGVNRYSNPQYNLKYAVADAREFSVEVKRQQEMLKRYAKVEVTSLSDAQATKANITQKLAQMAQRVQPEDAVIIYFAGHGTAHRNQFYLIPHDLGYRGRRDKLSGVGLQTILSHSISDRELERLFEGIDAGQLLLVIDACNSGQALEAEEKRRGPMNSKGLAQLAYEKGMYVLTAAQSYQAAQEAAKLGHGFLTYALVEDGLKQGAADREPKDGTIALREWLNYATDQVPKMQEENMLDALRGRSRYLNFVGDGSGPRDAGNNVQHPRIFYRRELETNPLIIAILGSARPGSQ